MADECLSPERTAQLRNAVKERYASVAEEPEGQFPYPVGRASALGLGYMPEWLDGVPERVVARFVGVGNPFSVQQPTAGERVLDVGSGCGLDALVAAALVGPAGRVAGIDLTPEMLEEARDALRQTGLANVDFRGGSAEALPFDDGSFDRVISNGVLNLVPDKAAAFREIRRVLRPGGTFAAADLLVTETVPDEVLADADAWST